MARILVTGDHTTLAGRDLLARLTGQMRADGHDAGPCEAVGKAAVREADALVAVLDRLEGESVALIAFAHAAGKPVLGLLADECEVAPWLHEACTIAHGADEAALMGQLPGFYDQIRPFAGRLVRDHIPRLVQEAGYEVSFRQLGTDEVPRFLRQKIVTEAEELARAEPEKEAEEIGDVLEALERFIEARGLEREDLRRVKEAKRKARGGFERCYVVEETSRPAP